MSDAVGETVAPAPEAPEAIDFADFDDFGEDAAAPVPLDPEEDE